MRLILTACAAVVALGACANTPSSTNAMPASVQAAAPASAPVTLPPPAPRYGTPTKVDPDPADVAKYKVDVANRIASANDHGVKNDSPRPSDASIKGLTVVGVQVRKDGMTDKVWVVRPSGDDNLDRKALESVKAALPLPQPPEDVMLGRGYTVFAESWIHRTDGKFQLVSKTTRTSNLSDATPASSSSSSVKRVSATKPATKSLASTTK